MKTSAGIAWTKRAVLLVGAAALAWFVVELDSAERVALPGTETDEPARPPAVAAGDLEAEPATRLRPPAPEPEPRYVLCRLEGAVTSGDGATPQEGAVVRLSHRTEEGQRLETSATTDADGRYAVELPLPVRPNDRRGRAWLALAVEKPGHGLFLQELWLDVQGSGPAELAYDVWLEPGGSFAGRIVDAGGEPIHRAEVFLYGALVGAAADAAWIEVASAKTLPDGRFALRASRPGQYTLRARADGHGATMIELGPRESIGRIELGDLLLSGGGLIAGRILDPEGHGLGGITVRAVSDEVGGRPGVDERALETARRAESGAGQLYGQARTNARGAFRIAGLAPGRFWLSCSPAGADGEARIDPGPYAVGVRDLELVLAEYRVQLVVAERPDGGLPRGRAYCVELEADGAGWRPVEDVEEADTRSLFDRSTVVFRVEPGRTYAVGLASSSLPVLEEIVTIDPAVYRSRVVLEPGRARSFGHLRLFARSATGSPLRAGVVKIRSTESGVALRTLTPPLGADGFLLDLFPGEYLIEVGPRGWPLTSRFLLPASEAVTVSSNETTRLELSCRTGGRLRVRLHAPESFRDRQLEMMREIVEVHEGRPVGDPRARRGALLTMSQAGGDRSVRVEWKFDDGLQPRPADRLLPGETASAVGAFEAGAWVLSVDLEGCEPVRQRVDVLGGEMTLVDVPIVEAARD